MKPWAEEDISPPGLWRARNFPDKDALAVDLDPARLEALISHAQILAAAGRDVETITAAELPLGPLAAVIEHVRVEVMSGRGIVLLRGFPIEVLSQTEMELVFWAIGLRLGRPVSQSVMGERLGHVRDVTDTDPHARAYRNRNELTPHTDPGDMLSFLCIRPAQSGGISRFVSSLTVHEEMRSARPDLLAVLYRGFHYHRFGEQGPEQLPITPQRIPVYSHTDGLVSCRYVRQYIEMAAAEDPDITISSTQREALDYFDAQTQRDDLYIEFSLEVGEAVVANNFTVLHARSGFEDYEDPQLKRHLLRLWLASDPPRPVVPDIMHYGGEPGIPPQRGRKPSYVTDVEAS